MKDDQSARERAAEEPEATNQLSPEMKQTAAQRAKQKSRTARWDLDVAVFFFAILLIIMILMFEGIGIEYTAPAAICGLAMGWLMGWKKGRQAYARFYDEELIEMEKELENTLSTLEEIIEEAVQKVQREEGKD